MNVKNKFHVITTPSCFGTLNGHKCMAFGVVMWLTDLISPP